MRRLCVLSCLLLAVLLMGCGKDSKNARTPVLGGGASASDTPEDLGFPGFATKNTTRVAGTDAIADAAGVAQAVFPARERASRPDAVALVDRADWRAAISAAQLMAPPLRAPLLFSAGGQLPAASKAALTALAPLGSKAAGKGVKAIRVGDVPATALPSVAVPGSGPPAIAAAIDRLHTSAAGRPSKAVLIASQDAPEYAMPAAAWAAKNGDPVLWVTADSLPPETRRAIVAHKRPSIYVLGPESVVSKRVQTALAKLGAVRRIQGSDPVRNAIAFARFSDGNFGWNVVDPGHGLVFASTKRVLDAAAAAPLSASGTYGPLLLVDGANSMPVPVQDYLLDIQPGYESDPVRGVYNHGWIMGDATAISVDVQSRIDALLEIQPVKTTS